MKRLLGHLAQFGSFSIQGEVLCTQSLAFLLGNSHAATAFAAFLTNMSQVPVSNDLNWGAEKRQLDSYRRPDLEGCSPDGSPRVKIEAKLGASFGDGQMQSYVADLQQRCPSGLFLVLLPYDRVESGIREVQSSLSLQGDGPWVVRGQADCTVLVTSWERIIDVLRPITLPSFSADLDQFEAMYRELRGFDIMPATSDDELRQWRREERNYVALIDRVTRALIGGGKRVAPMQREVAPSSYEFRYVCRSIDSAQPCFSVGVRDPFDAHGHATPVWMRFHRDTARFTVIKKNLRVSECSPDRLLESDGHVWIPIEFPKDVGGEELVTALALQVERIAAIALRPA